MSYGPTPTWWVISTFQICHKKHDMEDKIDATHNESSSMWQVIEGELSRSRGIYFARWEVMWIEKSVKDFAWNYNTKAYSNILW